MKAAGSNHTVPMRALTCAILLSISASGCSRETSEKPNWDDVRAFRVSQLSDQEIRDLRTTANDNYQRTVAEQKKMASDFWKARAATMVKCTDVVFEARNKVQCNQPLPLDWQRMNQLPIGHQTADDMFESLIMGPCAFAETAVRAREWGCLPKDP